MNEIIKPEINDEEFTHYIIKIIQILKPRHILEIGSSSGEGSTQSFITGTQQVNEGLKLYCLEASKERFEVLKKNTANYGNVKCYNMNSVELKDAMEGMEVIRFYCNHKGIMEFNVLKFDIDTVLGWLTEEKKYLSENNIPENGIKTIKKKNNIECFDMVLIDGSTFTGEAELELIYGAKVILLDDVMGIKNYNNYMKLKKDDKYIFYRENLELRNGFAIFIRKA